MIAVVVEPETDSRPAYAELGELADATDDADRREEFGEPMCVHQSVVMVGQHAPRRHALAEGRQHRHKLLTERRHTLGSLRDVGKMLVTGGAQ